MRSVVRSFAVVALALAAAFVPTGAAAGKKPGCDYHYSNALIALRDAVRARADAAADRQDARRFGYLAGQLERCLATLELECSVAANVASSLANDDSILGLEGILDAAADTLEARVEAEIDRIDAYLDLVAAAGNDTGKSDAVVEKARATLADAKTQLEQSRRLLGINQAIHELARAKRVVQVKKPPGKCKGRRLAKGEYCEGVAATNTLFQANIGSGSIRRNAEGEIEWIDLVFQFCNGDDEDRVTVDFSVKPGLGETDISGQGGIQHGLGFSLAMRPGSKATVTAASGTVIEGTFSFTALNTSFGNGRFRLTELTEP